MSEHGTAVSGPPAEVATSLSRGTNWWGAFVIGLAGTILVTGIVPFAVSSMGAAAISEDSAGGGAGGGGVTAGSAAFSGLGGLGSGLLANSRMPLANSMTWPS